MNKFRALLLGACLGAALLGCKEEKEPPVTDLVNPFVRLTTGDSVTPDTRVPFGTLRLIPDIAEGNRLRAFAYAYSRETDTLRSQAIRLMPTLSRPTLNKHDSHPAASVQAAFSPANEQASPGFYAVTLDNGVNAEFSLTKHCGMHSFRFPKGQSYGALLDLWSTPATGTRVKTSLWKASNRVLQGYRQTVTPDGERTLYFCLEFSQDVEVWTGKQLSQKLTNGQEAGQAAAFAWIDFGSTTNVILVKVGLSLQSEAEAFSHLQTELSHWSLDKVKREALQDWRRLLSRVRVKSDDTPALRKFYTALYHAYTIPLLYFDIREIYKPDDGALRDIYLCMPHKAGAEAERVFAALGFHPEWNDYTRYRLTCPRFPRVVLRLEQDRRFVIKANLDDGPRARVAAILLNGKPLDRSWITREEVVRGGTLEFVLEDE